MYQFCKESLVQKVKWIPLQQAGTLTGFTLGGLGTYQAMALPIAGAS